MPANMLHVYLYSFIATYISDLKSLNTKSTELKSVDFWHKNNKNNHVKLSSTSYKQVPA